MSRTQAVLETETNLTAFAILSVLIIISALGAYGWVRSEALVRLPLFFIVLPFLAIGSIAGARATVSSHLPLWPKSLILLCHLVAVLIAFFPLVFMILILSKEPKWQSDEPNCSVILPNLEAASANRQALVLQHHPIWSVRLGLR